MNLSGIAVHPLHSMLDLLVRDRREVAALREEAAENTGVVLVRASLAGCAGMGKVAAGHRVSVALESPCQLGPPFDFGASPLAEQISLKQEPFAVVKAAVFFPSPLCPWVFFLLFLGLQFPL